MKEETEMCPNCMGKVSQDVLDMLGVCEMCEKEQSYCLECQDIVTKGGNICPSCYANGAHK